MVTIVLIVVYLIDFIALILKLVEVINIDWVWVLFPYWFPILVGCAVLLITEIKEDVEEIEYQIWNWNWKRKNK